jgi:hypothetical protein
MCGVEQTSNIIAVLEAATADPASPLHFTPVRLRRRKDGWTPERQRRFVAWVALTGRSDLAAARVGMTPQSACRLRRHSEGSGFAPALEAAYSLAKRARRAVAAKGSSAFFVSREAEPSTPHETSAEPSARFSGALARWRGGAIARS